LTIILSSIRPGKKDLKLQKELQARLTSSFNVKLYLHWRSFFVKNVGDI